MRANEYQELNALVKKSIEGDNKAFTELCSRQAPMIVYACVRQMGDVSDGEDAAQEVLIKMYEKIGTLKNPEAFISWSQKLINSVCNSMRNKKSNLQSVPVETIGEWLQEEDSQLIPEEYMGNKNSKKELVAAVSELPTRCQECVRLFYFNEMKISDIARTLKITEGAVKAHLHYGRQRMQKTL